jgi:hypothetical protein
VGERVGEAAQGAPVGMGLSESGCKWGGICCQVAERASKGGPHHRACGRAVPIVTAWLARCGGSRGEDWGEMVRI